MRTSYNVTSRYYSSKDTIDDNGKEHFADAIAMAKQVFNSLTEYIQGPCQGNQVTLAHSRLWDAVVGFLHVFAQLQLKLSKDSVNSFELLSAVLDLQQDMVVMLLSMLEGNIVNGTIGRQLLDTLIESQQDVESIIRYFTMFLKLGDIIETEKFKDLDTDGKHMISKRDFQRQLEQSKSYSVEEIDYLLKCINSGKCHNRLLYRLKRRCNCPRVDIEVLCMGPISCFNSDNRHFNPCAIKNHSGINSVST